MPKDVAINSNESLLFISTETSIKQIELSTNKTTTLFNFKRDPIQQQQHQQHQQHQQQQTNTNNTNSTNTTSNATSTLNINIQIPQTTNNNYVQIVNNDPFMTTAGMNAELICGDLCVFENLMFLCDVKNNGIELIDLNTQTRVPFYSFASFNNFRISYLAFDPIRSFLYCASSNSIRRLDTKTLILECFAGLTDSREKLPIVKGNVGMSSFFFLLAKKKPTILNFDLL